MLKTDREVIGLVLKTNGGMCGLMPCGNESDFTVAVQDGSSTSFTHFEVCSNHMVSLLDALSGPIIE